MKVKNNRGFTMIEILGAIIIMGVLLLIAVPSVSKLMENFRKNYYKELEETLIASAKEYYSDNRLYRPNELLYSSTTSIQSLINKKYVENLNDYKGKSCSLDEGKSYVIVIYRGKNDYQYESCISCDGDNYSSDREGTYCDSAWRTNDNIKYSFSNSDDFYIYHESSREEVREKLLRNLKIVKYNTKGETLDSVALAESDKENVLPVNINELDTSVENEYPLVYKKGDIEETLNVVVYKHKAPLVELKNSDGSDYTVGKWTNKLFVKLSKNDNFFELSNTSLANYQWYVDGIWQNINCQMETDDTCSFTISENVDANYKFRLVTNEGKISYNTEEYSIKVDVDKPTINISPNGSNPIVYVGKTTGKIEFSLTTNDEGGSLIRERKYAISTSSKDVPSTFTNFYIDDINVSLDYEGNIYYVWAQTKDNAGNISTEVWPSNKFTMKYEVKYDANGGVGAPNTQYKIHGEDLTLSNATPTRDGYVFKGWATTSSSTTNAYTTSSKYTNNKSVILYAVWKKTSYTLTYNNNGGSGCSSKEVYYNSTIGDMCIPTRNGYTFVGWFDSSYKDTPLNYYADTYSDLKAAFGYNQNLLWNHYVNYIINGSENRRVSQYISTDIYQTEANKTVYAGWIASYPSVTVGNNYTVCPDDRGENTQSTCFPSNGNYKHNRFGVSNISYSNGVVSFNWSATMNSYSTTWVGSCQQRRVCVVKKGSNTCVGNWYYDFNAGTSSSWLSAGLSIGGSGSVTVDNSWAKGDYRLIIKNNSTCASSNERILKFAFDSIFDNSNYSYSSYKLFTIN